MSARVLVVDDSPTMRGLITAVLNADPDVTVIGQAVIRGYDTGALDEGLTPLGYDVY